MINLAKRADLAAAAEHFAAACEYSRMHDNYAAGALERWGDHGPQISGIVREHFPEPVRQHLRWLARQVAIESERAYAARPCRIRLETMRKLAKEIARRDGSGFYGPQP